MYAVIKDNQVLGAYNSYPPAIFTPVGSQVVKCTDSIPQYDAAKQVVSPPASPTNAPNQYIINEDRSVLRVYTVHNIPLAELKISKQDGITALRNTKLDSGFEFNSIRYDTKENSLQNINGMMTRLLVTDGFPEGFPGWIAEDNTVTAMTVEEFKDFAVAACDYIATLYAISRIKKDDVDALTTVDEVINYDITAGW